MDTSGPIFTYVTLAEPVPVRVPLPCAWDLVNRGSYDSLPVAVDHCLALGSILLPSTCWAVTYLSAYLNLPPPL